MLSRERTVPMRVLLASVVLLVCAADAAGQQVGTQRIYNPTADARAQIANALKLAKEDGIRVLVIFGTNDHAASASFDEARRAREVSQFFATEYKLVNVDVGRLDKNLDLAKAYGVALSDAALPMLAVLDGDGKVLARTSAAVFRSATEPAVFDRARIADFLTTHQAPAPADAEPTLQNALRQAKAEGKSLFVWFSAPW